MYKPGMKVVFITPGGGVGQYVGDVGTIITQMRKGDHLWLVDFKFGGTQVRWVVREDQMKRYFDVTEALKSLKRCLKSEI